MKNGTGPMHQSGQGYPTQRALKEDLEKFQKGRPPEIHSPGRNLTCSGLNVGYHTRYHTRTCHLQKNLRLSDEYEAFIKEL